MRLAACTLVLLVAAVSPVLAEDEIALCPAATEAADVLPEFDYVRGLHAAPDGWLYALRDYKLIQRVTPAAHDYMVRFTSILEHQGTQLLMAMVPNRLLLTEAQSNAAPHPALPDNTLDDIRKSYMQRLADVSAMGVIVPDLLTPMQALLPDHQLFFKRDHHWTPEGARYAAQFFADAVRTLPAMASLPQRAYTTTILRTQPHTGSYAAFAEKACHIEIAPEQLEVRQTTQANAGLMDDERPDIVLIGTSFSGLRFNFPGALAEALGHEVETVAVNGGGVDDAIIAYTSSPARATHKPAFLIWEMPDLYSFNSSDIWRQVIPAAQGECTVAGALAKGMGPVLDNLDGIMLTGGRDFLFFNMSDKTAVKFDIVFTYSDGKTETFRMDRSTRARNSGRFFLLLGDKASAGLSSIRFVFSGQVVGTITSRLCRGI